MEFKGVNPTKFTKELIDNGIMFNYATYDEKEDITRIQFEENQDIELIEKIYKEHNPEVEKDKTEIELLKEKVEIQDGAIMELAEIISNLGGM